MAMIGWFACKSLSDWVRYLVIVTCTGKSGIFRGQPVSPRGSNPDYSGRSTRRVNYYCLNHTTPFFRLQLAHTDLFKSSDVIPEEDKRAGDDEDDEAHCH